MTEIVKEIVFIVFTAIHSSHKKNKHFVNEAVNNKIISVEYLPTNDLPADVLTKCFTPIKGHHHMSGF